jgi:hypothetical protein
MRLALARRVDALLMLRELAALIRAGRLSAPDRLLAFDHFRALQRSASARTLRSARAFLEAQA